MAAENTLLNEDLQASINRFYPFLLEIRKRLLFLICLFFVFGITGFIYYERIITLVLSIFKLQGVNVVFTSPFQFINLAISCGLISGIIAIFPLIITQLFSFLKPALRLKEYRLIVSLLPVSIFLFVLGFSFGATMMKYMIGLFLAKSTNLNIGNLLDVSALLSTILLTSALMDLAFQFPVVLTILLRLKVIKHEFIARQRPFAYCAGLIFAALMPPTDLVSLLLLTLPLVFLFEITLLLNKVKIFKI